MIGFARCSRPLWRSFQVKMATGFAQKGVKTNKWSMEALQQSRLRLQILRKNMPHILPLF